MNKKYNERLFKLKIDELRKIYNFDGLYHFTDIKNFINIMNSGFLKSRYMVERNNELKNDGAASSVLSHTSDLVKKSVRFYYKSRVPTLFINEGIKNIRKMENSKEWGNRIPHIPIPVYLVFDEALIYHSNVKYSDGNASTISTEIGRTYEFFEKLDWKNIFSREPFIDLSDEQKKELKRIRQAEVLVGFPINISYLKKVIFRSKAEQSLAVNSIGENKLFEVNKNMFFGKHNFLIDYKIYKKKEINEYKYSFDLLFNKKFAEDERIVIEFFDYKEQSIRKYLINDTITFDKSSIKFYILNIKDVKRVKCYIYDEIEIINQMI